MDALLFARASIWQNLNILGQTVQNLWTIFEIKMAIGGHFEFLGYGSKILNNAHWTFLSPETYYPLVKR